MRKIFILLLFVTITTLVFAERDYPYSSPGLKGGYQGIIEMGYGFKVTDYGYDFLKVNVINGYRINPKFYLGFGTGLRLYFDNHALFNSLRFTPLFLFSLILG